MITAYRYDIATSPPSIYEVEFLRETKHFYVGIAGHRPARERRYSKWDYFRTAAAAYDAATAYLRLLVEAQIQQIAADQHHLDNYLDPCFQKARDQRQPVLEAFAATEQQP